MEVALPPELENAVPRRAMLGAPSDAASIQSPLPSAIEAARTRIEPSHAISAPAPETAREAAVQLDAKTASSDAAASAAATSAEDQEPRAAAAAGASQDAQAPSKEAAQSSKPGADTPGAAAAASSADAPAPQGAFSAEANPEAQEAVRQGASPAADQVAQAAGSQAPGDGAFPGASFEPDAGAIESLDSVHHAILNAAMMNKGMTSESRDDINMALDSRWKDPGDPHAEERPEAELPDSMLPMLKEVLPYIDFIAKKQQELEAAISERDNTDDAGAKLRALGQSIRETAEIGVSKGIAERDYVPTQITVNEPAPDPSDPFAGGSENVLARAGDEEQGSAGDGAADPAQSQFAVAQEPMRQAESQGPADEGQVPAQAPDPHQDPATAPVTPSVSQGPAALQEGPASTAPAAPETAPDASSGTANDAGSSAPEIQPPLSASEVEMISKAASEDLRADQEDAAAPGPMMFGPGEGFIDGRRPGESVQDMLARVQKAAMAQLEAEDHGEAGLGLGSADADTGAAGQLNDAQGLPKGKGDLQAAPQNVEPAPESSHESPARQDASPSGGAQQAQYLDDPRPADGKAAQDPGMGKPQVQEGAPVAKHGLRLIADPFSDDMSESAVEAARLSEDLAEAQAECAASAHPASVQPEAGQGGDAAKPAVRASTAMSSSLKKALLEIEGGTGASSDQHSTPANGQAPNAAPDVPVFGAKPAQAPVTAEVPVEPSAPSPASAPAQATSPAVTPAEAPFEPPAPNLDDGAAQGVEPPDFGQYVPPDDDDDPDDEDDAPEGFQEASQNEAAVAAFEGAQDSRVAQGVGEQAVDVTPEPLPDGDPASMPPAQRAELERIERIEAGQQVRPLIAQDFMPYVRKADPWLQDIEAAGYKDALYSALISSSRSIDPDDSSHWILKMSERFSYFINDPSFSHNLETKFSFMRNGHPVRITIEQCEGMPQGCPLALASKALRDETQKARSRLSSFKPFTRILSLAGADFKNVPITLYGSAGPKAPGRGGSGS